MSWSNIICYMYSVQFRSYDKQKTWVTVTNSHPCKQTGQNVVFYTVNEKLTSSLFKSEFIVFSFGHAHKAKF